MGHGLLFKTIISLTTGKLEGGHPLWNKLKDEKQIHLTQSSLNYLVGRRAKGIMWSVYKKNI